MKLVSEVDSSGNNLLIKNRTKKICIIQMVVTIGLNMTTPITIEKDNMVLVD